MSKLLSILVVLSIVTPVFSQERVRGVITNVDVKTGRIYLETRGLRFRRVPIVLETCGDTRVQIGLKSGSLQDLQVGQRARLLVGAEGEKMIALIVQVPKLLNNPTTTSKPLTASNPAPSLDNSSDVVTGELRRVSWFEREIVVLGGKDRTGRRAETIIQIPEKIRVIQQGKEISYEELEDGPTARIKTNKQNGQLFAEQIQIGEGLAPEADPEPKRLGPGIGNLLKRLQDSDSP